MIHIYSYGKALAFVKKPLPCSLKLLVGDVLS
jgi:hypothetical protein